MRAASAFTAFALVATPFMALVPNAARAAEGVSTDSATSVTTNDATLNATNNDVAAGNSSFWVSTSSINTAVPVMPPGVYSTPTLGPVAANGSFSTQLSAVETSGIPANIPGGIQPDTTYYYVAWVEIGGTWYPGDEETVTTEALPDTTAPDAPVISAPLNGGTYPSVTLVDWNDVTDPSSPVTYLYEADTDAGFSPAVYTSGVLTDSEIPTPGTPDGTYFVRVKAVDSENNESPWSDIVSFTIDSDAEPVIPACDLGDSTTFDPFALGNVNGQFGWSSTGAYDQEIVDNTYGYATFGCKSLRISNAVTSGSFGDQTFSYSVANEAGETIAENGGQSGGTRQSRYEAEFDIATTKPDSQQSGLVISVSPDRGDGARMSYLRFEDDEDGIDAFFVDVQSSSDPANFVETQVADDLSRATPHTIKFVIDFVDGPLQAVPAPANDVVEIYVDGALVHTGTTWENYYRYDNESNPTLVDTSRTVDSLIIRAGGSAVPANDEEGFLFDNMSIETKMTPGPVVETSAVTVCKYADTYPENTPLEGWTLTLTGDQVGETSVLPTGDSYTISGVPAGSYLISASGEYTYRSTAGAENSDAQFSERDPGDSVYGGPYAPWVDVNTFPSPYTGWLGVMMNGSFTNWGSVFSPTHEYAMATTTLADGDLSFAILDDQYTDNSGQVDISIAHHFSGVTDENGCVTFPAVPEGDYVFAEVSQEGWTPVEEESDLGEVVVDDETETFVAVNFNEEFGDDACVLVSDATTLEGGMPSDELTPPFHVSWTAVVDALAEWVWGDSEIADPEVEETQTFTKTFWLDDAPVVDATLVIAADNGYMVELNGTWSSSDGSEDNYTNAGKDTLTIPAGEFVAGANTLVFTVTNLAMGDSSKEENPAGLKYKLTIPGAECETTPPDQEQVQVHIYKYLKDADDQIALATEGSFPMTATWNATNIGAGTGGYSLDSGNSYHAATTDMDEQADYSTAEVTDGSVVVPVHNETCPADKYRLVGYKTGDTLIEAENDAIDDDAPSFDSLNSDKYVIVVNEDCDELDEPATPQVKVHVFKYLEDAEDNATQVPNDADIPAFDMTATWTAGNLNGGTEASGSYVLGNNHGGTSLKYAADTSAMDAGADYTTSEITGENGILPIGGTCVEGAYRLVGYKSGSTLEAAEASPISATAPVFTDLEADQFVIVVNEDCADELNEEPEEDIFIHIFKYLDNGETIEQVPNEASGTVPEFPMIAVYSIEGVGENLSPGDPYVLGNGGGVGGSDDSLLYAANTIALSEGDIYGTHEVTGGDSVVVASADACEEGKYVLLGYQVGSSLAAAEAAPLTSVSPYFDPVTEDQFVIVVNQDCEDVGGSETDEDFTITATAEGGGTISPAGSVSVASGSDQVFTFLGNGTNLVDLIVDGVSVAIADPYTFTSVSADHTIHAIFVGEGSGGGGGGGSSSSVLGAATDEPSSEAACVPLLHTYLRMGIANDAQEVMDLKGFLNGEMNLSLPVDSNFDEATDKAVRAFQMKYKSEVLDPWIAFGFTGESTGFVFKTTQWKINSIHCAPTVYPFPALP